MESHYVERLQFKLCSAEEIRAKSACLVKSSHLLSNNQPAPHSVYDTRFGATQKTCCSTCFHNYATCPGHVGHIELCTPILNPFHTNIILQTVRVVCYWCSKLLCEKKEEVAKLSTIKQRLKKIRASTVCPHCKGPQPLYNKLNGRIQTTWKNIPPETDADIVAETTRPCTQERLFLIAKHIAHEDQLYLGFVNNAVKDFFFEAFPVAPLTVRGSVFIGRRIGHDELTIRYQQICAENNKLKECENAAERTVIIDRLTNLICGLVLKDNNPQNKNGRTYAGKTIKTILESKDGQFRKYLMCKRVFHCGRSVITPQTGDNINVLGCPAELCLKLVKKIRVSLYNIEALQQLIANDPWSFQGAKRVIIPGKTNTRIINLRHASKHARDNLVLKLGMIVERPLLDGDLVIFNRQPSLHKYSIQALKVRVDKNSKTFRLGLALTKAFNADFDGDEMNLFSVQDEETEAELRVMMNVQSLLISAGNNRPIIAACQNTLIGVYLLSNKDSFFTREEVFQLSMAVRRPHTLVQHVVPAIVHPEARWTGKQLLSCLFPPDLSLRKRTRGAKKGATCMDIDERVVVVRQGVLLAGRLCKSTCGAVEHGFVQAISVYCAGGGEVGRRHALHFVSDLQRVASEFLNGFGFSISLGDFRTSYETQDKIEQTLESLTARATAETTETGAFQIAQKVLSVAGQVALDGLCKDNRLKQCIDSGAKGSNTNAAQIMACVGQQAVGGKRIPHKPGERSLPTFIEPSLRSKGMIFNSYLLGLTPSEFFFHCMCGREGMADTAVKTADSGYINRRIVVFLAGLVVHYDLSVRDSNGKIVQFRYGYTGLAPDRVESVQFESVFQMAGLQEAHGEYACELRRRLVRQYFSDINFEACLRLAINPTKLWQSRETWGGEMVDLEGSGVADAIALYAIVCLRRSAFPSEFVQCMLDRTEMALVDAGEAVGALAGTSIGEPVSQSTLNTFHFCGIASKNVTMGVPRINELLQISAIIKTPTVTVFLDFNASEAVAREMARALAFVELDSILLGIDVEEGPVDDEVEAQARLFEDFPSPGGPVMTIRLDKGAMKALGMDDPTAVAVAVLAVDDALVVYASVAPMDAWVVRVRGAPAPYLNDLKDAMGSIAVQGVSREITGALARTETVAVVDDLDGRLDFRTEYIFETDGTDLGALFNMKGIDFCRTFSNCPHDAYNTLGIEAARNVLLRELRNAFAFDGTYIHEHHLNLLVDQMCREGFLQAVSRHGLGKVNDNLLTKVAFEEPVTNIHNAAVNGEVDNVQGVAASIMLGQRGNYGTGFVTVITPPGVFDQKQEKQTKKKKRTVLSPSNDWFKPTIVQYEAGNETEAPLDDEFDIYGDIDMSPTEESTFLTPFNTRNIKQDIDVHHQVFRPATPDAEDFFPLTPLLDDDELCYSPDYDPE